LARGWIFQLDHCAVDSCRFYDQGSVGVLGETSGTTLFWTYFFGMLWGVGGLTYGLTMRYLGLSLGMAIVLGFCAASAR
jgi:hypothetical protein